MESQLNNDVIEEYLSVNIQNTTQNVVQDYLASKNIHPPFTFDASLFASLNDFYADKPLVPSPRKIVATHLFAQADSRINFLLTLLPSFTNLHCLEVGCGRGETVVRLAERAECDVTGVDITTYAEWPGRQNSNSKFFSVDLTQGVPFPPASFDFIYSFVVLEHVVEPLAMLQVIHQLLKPGGTFYFTANLYRGAMASHRYREVFFPWPHLLFEDRVFSDFYQQKGFRFDGKPAWVNKLTHLHYVEQIKKLGFTTQRCNYVRKALDTDFYNCFKSELGKYPQEDLEIDFIKMHLTKIS